MGPTFFCAELDDRREIWRLLDRLPEHRKAQWLDWCSAEASVGRGLVSVRVLERTGSTAEFFGLAMTIINQGRLTLNSAGCRLHRMVQGRV